MSALSWQADIVDGTPGFRNRLGLFDTCPRVETTRRTATS